MGKERLIYLCRNGNGKYEGYSAPPKYDPGLYSWFADYRLRLFCHMEPDVAKSIFGFTVHLPKGIKGIKRVFISNSFRGIATSWRKELCYYKKFNNIRSMRDVLK